MNISDYDVIYNERVYKGVDCTLRFNQGHDKPRCGEDKPDFLLVVCINSDGNVVVLMEQSRRFRFVRKGRDT